MFGYPSATEQLGQAGFNIPCLQTARHLDRQAFSCKFVDHVQQNSQSRFNNLLFDVKETKGGKPYLVITESRFKGEGSERQRSSIVVFPEQVKEFTSALMEIAGDLTS